MSKDTADNDDKKKMAMLNHIYPDALVGLCLACVKLPTQDREGVVQTHRQALTWGDKKVLDDPEFTALGQRVADYFEKEVAAYVGKKHHQFNN